MQHDYEEWTPRWAKGETERLSMQVWEIAATDRTRAFVRTVAFVFDSRTADEICRLHNEATADD